MAQQNIDSVRKGSIAFVIIIIVAIVIMSGLYIFVFDGGLSNDSAAWANFSNYFYGIIILLLTAFNIYLFYKLNIMIAKGNEDSASASNNLVNGIKTELQNNNKFAAGMALSKSLGIANDKLITDLLTTEDCKYDIWKNTCEILSICEIIRNSSAIFPKEKLEDHSLRNPINSYSYIVQRLKNDIAHILNIAIRDEVNPDDIEEDEQDMYRDMINDFEEGRKMNAYSLIDQYKFLSLSMSQELGTLYQQNAAENNNA